MGKKSTLKKIKRIAAKLPAEMMQTTERHVLTGIELKQEGFDETEKDIEDHRKYIRNLPVILQVNHNRRMKKIYAEKGLQGLNDYVEKVKQRNGKK